MKSPTPANESAQSSGETGLPLLHTWRAVYIFVAGSFVFWVALLIVLTEMYS